MIRNYVQFVKRMDQNTSVHVVHYELVQQAVFKLTKLCIIVAEEQLQQLSKNFLTSMKLIYVMVSAYFYFSFDWFHHVLINVSLILSIFNLPTDYFFLNDGDRFLGSLRRERVNIVRSAEELPSWLKKLIYEAKMRGTRLRILPAGFKKRCENKTAYQYSLKAIHWDIELEFTHITKRGESVQQTSSVVLHRVPENRTLIEVIQEYINPQDIIDKNEIWKNYRVYREIDSQNWITKIRLAKTTLTIDPSQQIRSILSGRTIIEYPTFIIGLVENKPESSETKNSSEEMKVDDENNPSDHLSSIILNPDDSVNN